MLTRPTLLPRYSLPDAAADADVVGGGGVPDGATFFCFCLSLAVGPDSNALLTSPDEGDASTLMRRLGAARGLPDVASADGAPEPGPAGPPNKNRKPKTV